MLKYLNPLNIIQDWFTCHWVGAAISVGGALLGGALGDDASQGAAGDANAGIQAGLDEINKIGDRTRTDTMPYRGLGEGASNKLSQLLGINIYDPSSAAYSGANNYSNSDLINIDDAGNFGMNEDLAKVSPEYKNAYDEFVNWHQGRFGTSANLSKDSNEGNAEQFIADHFSLGDTNNRLQSEFEKKSSSFTSDPNYGSLLKKFTTDDLNNDVVYQNGLQFGLNEGTKAIENRARALGGSDSGSLLKALTRFGNDYGTTKTEGAYNRFNTDKLNTFNMLMGGTGVGQNAVNTDANTGNQLAQALASGQASMGANNAAGRIGSANAWSGAIGNAANALGGIDWGSSGGGSYSGGGTSIPIKF